MTHHILGDSFETSAPWSRVVPVWHASVQPRPPARSLTAPLPQVCEATKLRILSVCQDYGVIGRPWVSCRVTQTYDTGACVYFYFAFKDDGLDNPTAVLRSVRSLTC